MYRIFFCWLMKNTILGNPKNINCEYFLGAFFFFCSFLLALQVINAIIPKNLGLSQKETAKNLARKRGQHESPTKINVRHRFKFNCRPCKIKTELKMR